MLCQIKSIKVYSYFKYLNIFFRMWDLIKCRNRKPRRNALDQNIGVVNICKISSVCIKKIKVYINLVKPSNTWFELETLLLLLKPNLINSTNRKSSCSFSPDLNFLIGSLNSNLAKFSSHHVQQFSLWVL